MNKAKQQTVYCRYCFAHLETRWTKKRDAPSGIEGEHEDKLDCAKRITELIPQLEERMRATGNTLARLRAAMPEVQRLALLRHPGLAQSAPAGMQHTDSGLVVPR